MQNLHSANSEAHSSHSPRSAPTKWNLNRRSWTRALTSSLQSGPAQKKMRRFHNGETTEGCAAGMDGVPHTCGACSCATEAAFPCLNFRPDWTRSGREGSRVFCCRSIRPSAVQRNPPGSQGNDSSLFSFCRLVTLLQGAAGPAARREKPFRAAGPEACRHQLRQHGHPEGLFRAQARRLSAAVRPGFENHSHL